MAAIFDPKAYYGWRRFAYMFTERCVCLPFYVLYNRLEISGQENIPEGPFVAVGNHISNLDPPLLAVAINRPVGFLAKEELFSIPLWGFLVYFFGCISVNRAKPEPSTFKAVKNIFAAGWCLGMFIEGTRSKTEGVLGQPHDGPAYFAKLNKLPILPIGITGTNKPWGKARVYIGKPLQPSADVKETSGAIMQALSDLTGFALPPKQPSEPTPGSILQ